MAGVTIEVASKFRSPNFSQAEELELLDLIDQYKHIILVRNPGYAAQEKKEETWRIIADIWSKNKYVPKRTADSLRIKWENLRKYVHKSDLHNPVTRKVHALMQHYKFHKEEMDDAFLKLLRKDIAEDGEQENVSDISLGIGRKMGVELDPYGRKCLTIYPSQVSNTEDIEQTYLRSPKTKYDQKKTNSKQKVRERGTNFTQAETSLLLQCVKREPDIFNTSKGSDGIALKKLAWVRVVDSYNKLSPKKRDRKTLHKKFVTIRNMVTHGFKGFTHGRRHERLSEDETDTDKIKSEVTTEREDESSFDNPFCNNDDVSDNSNDDVIYNNDHDYFMNNNESNERVEPEFCNKIDSLRDDETIQQNNLIEGELHEDPLGTMPMHSLLGDSGNGSSLPVIFDQVENPEILKLKLDLLKYEMETAKLQRQRIENLMLEDKKARESMATQRALRLRAARLEAVAAANKLPFRHKALHFPPSEAAAEQYLRQCDDLTTVL